MRYLDDISSLITIACCVPELRTIEFCPFPIENVLGGVLAFRAIGTSLKKLSKQGYLICCTYVHVVSILRAMQIDRIRYSRPARGPEVAKIDILKTFGKTYVLYYRQTLRQTEPTR